MAAATVASPKALAQSAMPTLVVRIVEDLEVALVDHLEQGGGAVAGNGR